MSDPLNPFTVTSTQRGPGRKTVCLSGRGMSYDALAAAMAATGETAWSLFDYQVIERDNGYIVHLYTD